MNNAAVFWPSPPFNVGLGASSIMRLSFGCCRIPFHSRDTLLVALTCGATTLRRLRGAFACKRLLGGITWQGLAASTAKRDLLADMELSF
jgi:hypothetical protein